MKQQMEQLIDRMVEQGVFFQDAVAAFETTYIRRALEAERGNRFQAAKVLGIHRNTIVRKMGVKKALATEPRRHRAARLSEPVPCSL